MKNQIDAYASAEILEEYTETVEYLKEKFLGKKPKVPLIDIEECYLVHCISSDFALGAGIAKEFRKRGCVDELVKRYPRNSWNGEGYCVQTPIRGFAGAYHLVTKQVYWHKPSYMTIRDSLKMLHFYVNYLLMNNDHVIIAMPKIGCGLDKLKWHKVKPMIEEEFKNVDIDILVCSI